MSQRAVSKQTQKERAVSKRSVDCQKRRVSKKQRKVLGKGAYLVGETARRGVWVDALPRDDVPNVLKRGTGWFINAQTRPLHASEGDETRRQGPHSSCPPRRAVISYETTRPQWKGTRHLSHPLP